MGSRNTSFRRNHFWILAFSIVFSFFAAGAQNAYAGESGYIVYTSPSSFMGGVPTTVTVRVKNTGDSDDMLIECASKPPGWSVSPSYRNPYMSSGAYYNATFTVTPPVLGGSGTIKWEFRDDDVWSNDLLDTEYQSVSASASRPDLIAYSISLSDTTVDPGQNVTVYWTAKNKGDASCGSSQQGVMWSTNSTISTSDTLREKEYLGSMNAGETSPEAHTITIPSNATPGNTYYIGIIADYDNDITNEASESNNNDGAPVAITININHNPVASRSNPTNSEINVQPGTQFFTVRGTDQDGNLDGVEWYVDGQHQENGNLSGSSDTDGFSYNFSIPGKTYIVEATVFDKKGAYSNPPAKWTVNVIKPTGDLTAILRNIGDSDLPSGDGTPMFLLYTSPLKTQYGSPTTFGSVPTGTYLLEGYFNGNTPFNVYEFWNSEQATIGQGANSHKLIRKYPFASDSQVWDTTRNKMLSPTDEVPLGNTIQFRVPVKSNLGFPLNAKLVLWIDTNNDGNADIVRESSPAQVSSQGIFFLREFDTTDIGTGQIRYAIAVYTQMDSGAWQCTDSWDWIGGCVIVDEIIPTIIQSSPSGAKIYLDDSNIGTTPYSSDEFYVGSNLKVYLPGYDIYETTLESEDIGTTLNCSLVAVGSEWTTYSANASNTSFLNTGPFHSVSEEWTYTTPSVAWSQDEEIAPTVADNQVFMVSSYNGGLYCLDLLTGGLNWSRTDFNTGTSRISNQPSVSNGLVVCGVSSGYIIAFDVVTGETVWQYYIGKTVLSNITIHNSTIYVNVNGVLHCLDLHGNGNGTTNQYWETKIGSASSWPTPIYNWSTPAISQNRLVVATNYGVNHTSGVYEFDGGLICLDANPQGNGDIIWSIYDIGGENLSSSPVIAGDSVFFMGDLNILYDIDIYYEISNKKDYFEHHVYSNPATDGSMLIYSKNIGSWTNKWALIAKTISGTVLWQYGDAVDQRPPNLHADPVISNSDVIFWSEDGYLVCLNKFNGQLRWEQQYPNALLAGSQVSLTNNGFLFTLDSGRIGWWSPEGWTTLYHYTAPELDFSPVISDIPNDSVYENDIYVGPTPILEQGGSLPVTWLLVSGPLGMTINSNNGVVQWPAPTTQGSPYSVTIRATNLIGSYDETWQLSVSPSKISPLIEPISDDFITEGGYYIGLKPVLQQGTLPVVWSLESGPSGMDIDSGTGIVSWENATATGSPYQIVVRATNSAGYDEESWELIVRSSSTIVSPIINSISDDSTSENVAYTGITPTLQQGTVPIIWSLVTGPSGMTINSSTGVVYWSNPTTIDSPHVITIRASNSAGSDEETWLLSVSSNAVTPVIFPINDVTIITGLEYFSAIPSLEQGTAPIVWSLIDGPNGMTIDSETGSVYWSNPTITGSPHTITIRVTNAGGSDEESWLLTVEEIVPVITTITQPNGPDGSYIKITGTYFGSTAGNIDFSGTTSDEIVSWSATEIYCRVPQIEISGACGVQVVRSDSVASESKPFTVTQPGTIHVDLTNTSGIENGAITYPFSTIQRGIDAATGGGEVYVAGGGYFEAITMKDGVNLYGGYDSNDWTAPRDPNANQTIVNWGGGSVISIVDANVTFDGFTVQGSWGYQNGGGIYCASNNETTFTVKISNNIIQNNTLGRGYGAGIYCDSYVKPIIIGNIIRNNTISNMAFSTAGGGGIYCAGTDCEISGNVVVDNQIDSRHGQYSFVHAEGGGIWVGGGLISDNTVSRNSVRATGHWVGQHYVKGGGIYCDGPSTITRNLVEDNVLFCQGGETESGSETSEAYGGGIYAPNSEITFNIVKSNTSKGEGGYIWKGHEDGANGMGFGGGIYAPGASLVNNLVVNNDAIGKGGNGGSVLYLTGDTSEGGDGTARGGGIYAPGTTVVNNTVADNQTIASFGTGYVFGVGHDPNYDGTAISEAAGIYADSNTIVNNAILWDNSPDQLLGQDCNNVTYCDISDGTCDGQNGNISTDPLFVNSDSNDFHLLPDSNCIDTGDPNSPWENEPLPNGARINMGAYGNTNEATRSRADLQFVGFNVISKTRIARTTFQYTLSLSLENIGSADVDNVTVNLIAVDEQVTNIVDDTINYVVIPAGSMVNSDALGDYFVVEIDRAEELTPGRLTWQIDYSEIEGSSMQIMSLGLPAALGVVGDITGEGKVNYADLVRLAEKWLWTGTLGSIDEDIAPYPDGDGIVNFLDFALLAENWLVGVGQ